MYSESYLFFFWIGWELGWLVVGCCWGGGEDFVEFDRYFGDIMIDYGRYGKREEKIICRLSGYEVEFIWEGELWCDLVVLVIF